jgi:hypothetical protein
MAVNTEPIPVAAIVLSPEAQGTPGGPLMSSLNSIIVKRSR